MIIRLTRFITFVILVFGSSACAAKSNPDLSPEGKAAYYGEKFMSLVEQAQLQTIALVGTNGITRADVTPAVEVFVQIGRGGQDLAAALKIIDESNITTTDRKEAAERVRIALTTFQDLLNSVTVRVTSETVRARIVQVIAALKLSAALFDVVQKLAPSLRAPSDGAVLNPCYRWRDTAERYRRYDDWRAQQITLFCAGGAA